MNRRIIVVAIAALAGLVCFGVLGWNAVNYVRGIDQTM